MVAPKTCGRTRRMLVSLSLQLRLHAACHPYQFVWAPVPACLLACLLATSSLRSFVPVNIEVLTTSCLLSAMTRAAAEPTYPLSTPD
jgi:hypothetical protein